MKADLETSQEVDAKRKKKKKRQKGWLVTGVTLVIMVLGLMIAPGVREYLCRSVADWPTPLPFFCGDEYVRVDQVEAEKFLLQFYGRASGADPRRAHELLTDAERQRVPVEDFAKRWEDRAWAELIDIEPAGGEKFNTYKVFVRHYEGRETAGMLTRGDLVVRSSEATLRKTGGVVRLEHESEPLRERITTGRWYPRARLLQPHGTFFEATADSQPAVFSDELSVGGTLNVLCRLRPPASDQSFVTEDWVRTPQGWIPAGALSSLDGAEPECNSRYATVRQ